MQSSLESVKSGAGYLRCQSAGTAFGVPLDAVTLVDRPERVEWNTQPSGPRGWLRGGDSRVPVYGLAQSLQLPKRNESFGALVRLRGGWALGFDRVERSDTQVAESELRQIPSLIRPRTRAFFQGVAQAGSEVVLCLNVDRLSPEGPPPAAASLPASRARLTSTPAPTPQSAMRTQLLRFWVPDVAVSLGLSARQVVEFSTDPPVTVIPGAHPALPGVAVWRGEPVAILDLGLALGLSTRPAPCRRLLMVQVDRSVGLVAIPTGDAMPRLQGVSEFQPASNRSGVPPDLVRGVFEDSAGRMAVPDLASIVQSPSFS